MAAEPAEMQGGREDQMSLEVGIYMRKRDCLHLVTARIYLPGNNDALMPNLLIEEWVFTIMTVTTFID